MTYQAIRVETKDGVTLLTLNRPERFNALNRQMIGEILDVLAKAKPGSDTRTIVITGAGRGFCGGADLKDPAGVLGELRECRKAHPDCYIKLNAFDSTRGFETMRMS
ncbi:MAG TPA: enoyl-CoA hydratase-related protein, partial [Rhodocyclaceae bacterium]|nr:enoyl-CoA hydratase-related protein [Rhodocyclaceae bacterium]